jgi:hypothetical protein
MAAKKVKKVAVEKMAAPTPFAPVPILVSDNVSVALTMMDRCPPRTWM